MKTSSKTRIEIDAYGTVKLQLSAICYDANKKEILIMKRSNNVEANAGKWEFGHVLADGRKRNKECIVQGYLKKYNIGIELVMDKDRKDEQPEPLFLYQYEKSNDCNRGVTVLANVVESEGIRLSTLEYSEHKWIKEDDIGELSDDECVDDLKISLRRAFEVFGKQV